MSEPAPSPELLRALGRLVRGLSALFWGLPAALIVCAGTAFAGWFESFGPLPPLASTSLLVYGLVELRHFQRQERVWHSALDRAQFLGVVMAGLSPFLFWWNRRPADPFFSGTTALLLVTSLIFLNHLNVVLRRLTAMLPDETLRAETRHFTLFNRVLLCIALALAVGIWCVRTSAIPLPFTVVAAVTRLGGPTPWLLLVFVLLPLAMTMALIWKTKEVILESIFGRAG